MSRMRLAIVGLVALAAFGLLVGLGLWQLERLAWKEALVARIEDRMRAGPVEAPAEADWPNLDFGSWAYRRVTLRGTFDHAREARIYVALSEPRGRYGGPGYFILTPLARADGSAVIVNRGFAPEGRAEPTTRAEGQPQGEVAVTGLLREPEDRNLFTPKDDPTKRLFFARDATAIAAGLSLARTAPFTVDADATPNPGGLPQGGETRLSFPNRHMEYALTWFGLAGTLVVILASVAWGRIRERRRDGAAGQVRSVEPGA